MKMFQRSAIQIKLDTSGHKRTCPVARDLICVKFNFVRYNADIVTFSS